MSYNPVFTQEEQKIRRRWLLCFLGLIVLTTVNFLYLISQPAIPALVVLFEMAFCFFIFGVQYYFIYKKWGTRWLTFLLISTPIANGLTLYAYATSAFKATAAPLPISLLSSALALLYLIPCYQLRKVNKRIQLERKAKPIAS